MSDQLLKPRDQIIVVEDSPPNRRILSHLLEKLGFTVIGCENGQEAWDIIAAGKCPHLVAVISDIMMPLMDGIELLRHVRGHEKHSALPFVLVTAMSEKEYIAKAKELKVNGYILKPVTFQRVTEKMQELFPSRVLPKLVG